MDINIKSYATDGIDSLSLEDKLKILGAADPFRMILLKVNLNKNNVSGHNVYLEQLDKKTCQVYQNGEWIEQNTNTVIGKLTRAKIIDMIAIYGELRDYLRNKSRCKFECYLMNCCLGVTLVPIRKYDREPLSILKKGITLDTIKI